MHPFPLPTPTPGRQSLRERFNLSAYAIRYPWLTVGFWLGVMLAGALAFSGLKYALLPDVAVPIVVVDATSPQTTVTETVQTLTQPMEAPLLHLSQLEGDGLRSITYPGRSIVSLAFKPGTDLQQARQQVTDALKSVTWPTDSTHKVNTLDLNEAAVTSYVLTSTVSATKPDLGQLTTLAQQEILPDLSQIPGVRKVELVGVPDGASILTPSMVKTAAEIAIKSPGSSVVSFNRQPGLAIQVIKQGHANALEVVQQVQGVIARLQPQLETAQLHLASSQAGFIHEANHATLDALWLAVALSVLVIWLFLGNWRATLISALAIPTSLLGTFVVLAWFGLNLDTITLLALALVIGIIVDDAIVDVENISRHLDEGVPPRQAAIEATNEIGLTVTAATFTIVAVFLPVALMQGSLGQFFRPFGITVAAAVLISLLVARTLSPLMSAKWLRPQPQQPQQFLHRYQLLLQWALRHRWRVLALALVTLVMGLALVPAVPKGFIPQLDRGEFLVSYTTPLPTSRANLGALLFGTQSLEQLNPIHRASDVAQQLANQIRKLAQVDSVFTVVGHQGRPNEGTIHVRLKSNRTQTTAAVEDQVRQRLSQLTIAKLEDVKVTVSDIPFVSTATHAPLELAFTGNRPLELQQTAEKLERELAKQGKFQDFDISGTAFADGKVMVLEQLNHQPVVYLRAQLAAKSNLGDATSEAIALANQIKPAGVKLNIGGDSGQMISVFTGFAGTLVLSVLCIFGVLALLFRSWSDPLIIIFALPLALIGAVLAVLLTGTEFGVISVIGIVFLLGLINKNAILLVDYTNQLRQSGLSRTSALLQAGPVRLRPILMTTTAMILGMLPIALGWGTGAELRAPMAIAIIGGLLTSTLLSLVVVPVLYSIVDDWRHPGRAPRAPIRVGETHPH